MKKLFATALALSLITSTAIADPFYKADVPGTEYYVVGLTRNGESNPMCVAAFDWRDGSSIQFIKDLADGEFYIWFRNNQWSISDPEGSSAQLRANFIQSNGYTVGLNFDYKLINKNTIVIPNIITDKFIPPFSGASKLQFIMPGSITNAQVTLNGSTRALIELTKCVEFSKDVDLEPKSKKPDVKL